MSELSEITESFENGTLDAVEFAARLRPLNLLMIGTAKSEAVHKIVPQSLYFDLALGIWTKYETMDVLRATGLGKVAVACALFGDMNHPGQRSSMGYKLVTAQGPHFGFADDPNRTEGVCIHMTKELYDAVSNYPDLSGAIDIVDGEHFQPTSGRIWGKFSSKTDAVTLATVTVTPQHLPQDIHIIDYDEYRAT